ncbi:MAG TPA: hypothetical protein VLM37_03510 [Fibrobacteraceae bacterium]|nr:hypothetical protein [Fibrobacteraceae bacterium]
MKAFLFFFGLISFSFAQPVDSTKILRIRVEIPSSWEQSEYLRNGLETSLNGQAGFHVVPRAQIAAMLAKAKIDPFRRDSSEDALIESHFPARYHLELQVAPPLLQESRKSFFFWMGQRKVKLAASMHLYATDGSIPELRGDFSLDTLVSMGYCGLLECAVRPMDSQTRLQLEQSLYQGLISKIKNRLDQLLVLPANAKPSAISFPAEIPSGSSSPTAQSSSQSTLTETSSAAPGSSSSITASSSSAQ